MLASRRFTFVCLAPLVFAAVAPTPGTTMGVGDLVTLRIESF